MPYRVIINGVQMECDTAAEAMALVGGAKLATKRPTKHLNQAPSQIEITAPVTDLAYQFLTALKEAHPNTMTGVQIAARIGTPTPKSLPPIVMAVRNWTKQIGANFESVVIRKTRFENGKFVSTYAITKEGIKKLNDVRGH